MFEDKAGGTEFFVFHPSWGYFADAYGLKQIPFEIEGKEPGPGEMARLSRYAREKGIKVVFVQPQFSTKSAEAIAREIGGRLIIADPLREDWMKNLREVAAKFRAALK
jgi:zinc transport system substrate-binding protein